MKLYELAIVLDGEATAAKKKAVIANIETIVKVNKGKIVETDEWGKKELAYKIGKSTSGLFIIFTLELEPKVAAGLPSKIKLEEDIIRYLLIAKEKKADGKKSK